ncbi:FMN-binding protein [Lacinutrix sp. Bg11-31]|uniref:FMN-binding protein n=1 Tax=Lacinutrix sp. Bg11-31 TaxID=2057808 RepID=UPI000C304155|nr:FMN-binding protein [Lacinutrix sp. Bg11-31]AUC82015.1 FMN-binding protein [Lacinutrix sp. Bg11-31]
MYFKKISILVFALTFLSFGLPKNIQKKVDKEIKSAFEIENFSFESKTITSEIVSTLPSVFGKDNFFSIKNNNKLLGYAYVSKAPSKTDEFDYLVLLDANLIVKKAKILVYREDYGGEIGSKRWLKQFIGKTKTDELRYNDTVVAISGATISVRAMTTAMNDLLQSLKILNEKGIL